MKPTLLLLFLTLSIFSHSQKYNLTGTVMDESNQIVEGVTCILNNVADSTKVKTVLSDSTGRFHFSGMESGNYMLTLRHMVYKTESSAISISNSDIETPPYILEPVNKQLKEIVVNGERPIVKAMDGKLIYDAPQLIQGKTVSNAFETLQNIPGIMGSGDEIQLAGSSEYAILLNGKKTSMSVSQLISLLKSMPASRVANVEIMYSAPPQYNVRGAAINVVLKEQSAQLPTLQGEGSAEYKQAFYEGFNLRGNLLYAKPSFNADLTVGINKARGWGKTRMYAVHESKDHVYDITQNNKHTSDYKDINMRLGLGYTFKNKDKISLAYTNELSESENTPSSHTIFLQDDIPYTDIRSQNHKAGNDYMHNLKTEYNSHKQFNIGVDYTYYHDPATDKYFDYLPDGNLQTAFKTETGQKINKALFYANHNIMVAKTWKINYGANFSMSNNNNKYDYYKDPDSNSLDSISDTKQKEYTGSVFAGISKSFNSKLSAQASVSANYFKASIDIMGAKKTLWDDFQPFANVNLTYMYSPMRILQFSFSSDIDYPPYWALSTDRFKINAYSQAVGNPELKFSKKYKSQLTFIANQKYIIGASYEYNPDRYIQLPYQSQNALENIFQMVNLDYSKQYSLFLVVPFKINKIWDSRTTLSLMRQEQKDDNFYDTPYKRGMNSFVISSSNTFNISSKPDIKFDLSGFYMHGAIQGIYDIKKMWDVNAGVKWTFMNRNAELMFKVEDIFKSRTANTVIDYMNQYNTMKIYANAPVFRLSFTYRFGNYKKPKVEGVDTSRFGR
ncbi:TonB-dependent receptor family protein [Dysgonomonas sp. 511]|uniref:TonB-dependent receptor family protein n=1 Tax=Dysgonomonas sp. 511 TaxID=2302930 RepID=UPI0013D78A70|nr:TonB-dependent receptor family protein [Dysgonomonas sp. 511]NDV77723.1 hypothetical protein [Dysgonomonas sp. 511]